MTHKLIELQKEIRKSTMTGGCFLSSSKSRQKISKEHYKSTQPNLKCTEHSIQQQTTHSFQMHLDHLSREPIL